MRKNSVKIMVFSFLFISMVCISFPTISKEDESTRNFDERDLRSHDIVEGTVEWTENGVAISTASSQQYAQQIISDGQGGAIITWMDKRSLSTEGMNIYSQRIDKDGKIKWTVNGVAICTASDTQSEPQLVSDGQGGAIITWYDFKNTDFYGSPDIYVQKINSTGYTQWTPNGIAICTASHRQSDPRIVSDGQGGAIITWEDERSGTPMSNNFDIYAQKINSTGKVQWTPNGTAICTVSNPQSDPQLVSDNQGGAIITWEHVRSSGNDDIYAQKINSTGKVQWTSNGTAICMASDRQIDPQLVSDGQGGAIITWMDERISGNFDIYAQKINSIGNVQWTPNGTAICTANGGQARPQLTIDGQGGAIITWDDERSIHGIYAQRISSMGNMQWTANGTIICTTSANYPQIVNDGQGGAIITWEDVRDYFNIFAQRISSTGETHWIKNGIPICTANDAQCRPQLVSDGQEGAIITWDDIRGGSGTNDVYAQRTTEIRNKSPFCAITAFINTKLDSTAYINWTLIDDVGGGNYSLLLDNIPSTWHAWTNNTLVSVLIDTSLLGTFNYTIQYYDSAGQFGIQGTVIVAIIDTSTINLILLGGLIVGGSMAVTVSILYWRKFKKTR